MHENIIRKLKPAFVFFDENVLDSAASLEVMLNATMQYTREDIPVLLMCEAYCKGRKRILEAAYCAQQGNGTQAFLIFDTLYKSHMQEIASLMDTKKPTNSVIKSLLTCMENTHENMRLLLSGVTRLKELSNKTSSLLMSLCSALAAYTVALYLQLRCAISVHIIETIDEIPNVFEASHVYVALAYNDRTTKIQCITDALAAVYAKKAQARIIDIWTHTHGVMTANTEYVAKAQPVRTLSYEMALEIAMLGGRVFHPLALQMLMKERIPISIYSTATAQHSTCITASQELTQISETVITNQNSCTICTVSSTDMFHRYGYVEKLFRICSQHGVSVETISTSEISVTISFFTQAYSDTFLSDLRSLGEVRCADDYSLISLISSKAWNSPQKIASILSCIPEPITIETLSLGNCELSFSFAVKSLFLKNVIQSIHDVLYPSLR